MMDSAASFTNDAVSRRGFPLCAVLAYCRRVVYDDG